MTLPDGLGLVFNPPAISGLGAAGGFEAYIQAAATPTRRNSPA